MTDYSYKLWRPVLGAFLRFKSFGAMRKTLGAKVYSERNKKSGGLFAFTPHAPKINKYSYTSTLYSKLQTAQTTSMWLQN